MQDGPPNEVHCDGTTDAVDSATIRTTLITKTIIVIRKLYVMRNSSADCALTPFPLLSIASSCILQAYKP